MHGKILKNGGYIATFSKIKEDLSNKSMNEISEMLKNVIPDNRKSRAQRLKDYEAFLSLNHGDCIAVNNTNDGLFGIGVIAGNYYFRKDGHNTGSTNPEDFYCHFYPVKWLVTTYLKRNEIVRQGEKGWKPYGIIAPYSDLPGYIKRILDKNAITLNEK
ncbi:MAG: hypothetical protein WCI77_06780 [Candidatus Omnitrophota bacterium]